MLYVGAVFKLLVWIFCMGVVFFFFWQLHTGLPGNLLERSSFWTQPPAKNVTVV
jgi:hypothetical protein